MALVILILLALTTIATTASGHGAFVYPPARGTCNTHSINNMRPRNPRIAQMYKPVRNPRCARADCPHCLNAGGKGAVIKAAKGVWRPFEPLNDDVPFRRDSGMCGDPAVGIKPHEKGGMYAYPRSPIGKTYKFGGKVQFVVDLTTNHNGFFEFFICDAKKCGGDINERCFKQGHCHQLQRTRNLECESQNSVECGPIDPEHPGRWYVPCRKGGHVGEHFMGGPYMEYQLPSGFSSEHAVIQWYWATANSCNPPGFAEYFEKFPMKGWGRCPGDGGALGGRNPTIAKCGGKNFPEEFWNCADVAVTESGTAPVDGADAATQLDDDVGDDVKEDDKHVTSAVTPEKDEELVTEANGRIEKDSPRSPVQAKEDDEKVVLKKELPENTNDVGKKELSTRKKMMDGNVYRKETCAISWTQCGGRFYQGPRNCCDKRHRCVRINRYYSQCRTQRLSRRRQHRSTRRAIRRRRYHRRYTKRWYKRYGNRRYKRNNNRRYKRHSKRYWL